MNTSLIAAPTKTSLRLLIAAVAFGILPNRVSVGDPTILCENRLEIISRPQDGSAPDGIARDVVMTPDGRFVVFASVANNLVQGDLNNRFDVFVLDRDSSEIENVHRNSAGDPGFDDALEVGLAVTPSGRFVAFCSNASNLAPNGGQLQVYVRDRDTDQTEMVSVNNAGNPQFFFTGSPAISDNGRYVAYWGRGISGNSQVFLWDRTLQTRTLISKTPAGTAGNDESGPLAEGVSLLYVSTNQVVMSSDARYIAFMSEASDLVAGDVPNTRDVFIYDRLNDVMELVSVGHDGSPANDSSLGIWTGWTGPDNLAMTPDGRYVVFDSAASNLVPDDPNGKKVDFFVRDRQLQTTRRLEIPNSDLLGNPLLSADGRYLFFIQFGTNPLTPGHEGGLHRFRYDLQTDTIAAVYATGFGPTSIFWTNATPGAVTSNGEIFAGQWNTGNTPEFGNGPQIFLRFLATEMDDDCNLNLIPDPCEAAFGDVAAFVSSLLEGNATEAVACLFDRNGDGDINGRDIEPFMNDLLEGM